MGTETYRDDRVSFEKPDVLTLRVQAPGDAMIYRLNHAEIRMELNLLVGEVETLVAMATPTRIRVFPAADGSGVDVRQLAGLFLGAVEADALLEAGQVEVLAGGQGSLPGGLEVHEKLFLVRGNVHKYVALLVRPGGSTGVVVGYLCHRDDGDAVRLLKDGVLASLRLA